MSNKKRNRRSRKGNEKEIRTGNVAPTYHKLPENPRNLPTDNASTGENGNDGKWSRSDIRKDDKEESW